MELNVFNRNIYVYDLETCASVITYTGYNIDTKEVVQYVLHKDRFELLELINHLEQCKGQIGFNNIGFDYPIIHYIMELVPKLIRKAEEEFLWDESNEEIITLIYNKSQEIINAQDDDKYANLIQEKNWKIHQLDLYKIWHFDNKAKRTSLKWIQYMIDYPNIEEMPINHSTDNITLEQVDSILSYNLNDVMSTYELFKITKGDTANPLYKGIDKIQLRKDIVAEFNIKCLNYNDVKIGDEINKTIYSKLSEINKYDIPKKGTFRKSIKVKDCIKKPIQFESLELQYFYNDFLQKEFNSLKVKEEKGKEFTFKGLDITFGFGGIHSIDKPRDIYTDNEYYLSDKDCTGMYPRTIIEQKLYPRHLGLNWYKGVEYVYNERAYKYKPLIKKGDKKAQSYSEAYKLANNGGGFGKTNESYSWQYDPLVMFSVTIFNQFALLKFAEMLLLNNISVVSLNTDGCLSLVRYDQKDLYEKLSKEWELLSNHTLEETLYSRFIQTSVNDYIAVTLDGKIKKKGDFTTEFELHKNKSARIVPIALENYFINNIPINKTIHNHNNIYDFCLGVKSIGGNQLITFNKKTLEEIKLQKVNRYYISTNGINILKRLPKLEGKQASNQLDIFGNIDDGTREAEIEAGWLSTIFNQYVEKDFKDYNICYKYYEQRCDKIINKIKQ
jgi:hypothetical protein